CPRIRHQRRGPCDCRQDIRRIFRRVLSARGVNAGGPDWARLFRIASSLIRQVNANDTIIDSWSFGGGTAMMLQIGHRESDPKLHDFEFEIRPSDYIGDGAGFLKLAFEGIGEIDFIVAHALTMPGASRQAVEGEDVALE